MKHFSIILLTLVSTAIARATNWNMSDVSILFPLPNTYEQMNAMLAPGDAAKGGDLLPKSFYEKMPTINQGEPMEHTYQNLRAVALRIDPCFDGDVGPCLKQIRIIWQPIGAATYGSRDPRGLETKDAALHTFHTLSNADFSGFISAYKNLIQSQGLSTEGPLQVHPIINAQGLTGKFAQGLKALVLHYCGAQNFWRMTSMKTGVGSDQWEWSGINIRNGRVVDITIPRSSGATNQIFSVAITRDTEFINGQISPSISPSDENDTDRIDSLIRYSSSTGRMTEAQILSLAKSVARIENPTAHSPNSMDCISCHTAQTAGSILMRSTGVKLTEGLYKPPTKLPMENTGKRQDRSNVLRAFGYFEKDPILSRRIINETAAVVGEMNSKY